MMKTRFHAQKPVQRQSSAHESRVMVPPDHEPLLEEEPWTIHDDEPEIYDLGFMIDDHDDRRWSLLEHWQRLETLDSDEALETGPREPLPVEARAFRSAGVPATWHPAELHVGYTDAERDEDAFAAINHLRGDPDEELVAGDGEEAASALERDGRAAAVGIRGHAAGIAAGFGTSVPQDIGPDGFSIKENPLR